MDRQLPEKATYGQPCNGCGQCCQMEVCPLGAHLFGQVTPCPALVRGANGSACGLIEAPGAYALAVVAKHGHAIASRSASVLVGAGHGCDARVEGEPDDPAFRRSFRDWVGANRLDIHASLCVWGMA